MTPIRNLIEFALFWFVMNFHHQSVGLYSNCGTAQGYDLISASRGMTGIDNKRNIIVSATALGKTIEKIALVKEQGQTEIRFFREKCMRS